MVIITFKDEGYWLDFFITISDLGTLENLASRLNRPMPLLLYFSSNNGIKYFSNCCQYMEIKLEFVWREKFFTRGFCCNETGKLNHSLGL